MYAYICMSGREETKEGEEEETENDVLNRWTCWKRMQTTIKERKCSSRLKMTLMMAIQLITSHSIPIKSVSNRSKEKARQITVKIEDILRFDLFIFNISRSLWLINLLFVLLHLLSCLVYTYVRLRYIWSAFTKDFFFRDHIFRFDWAFCTHINSIT